MDKVQRELFETIYSSKVAEIHFDSPKTVKLAYTGSPDEVVENVHCIDIMSMITGTVSIQFDYTTENGDGSISSSMTNYDSITIIN